VRDFSIDDCWNVVAGKVKTPNPTSESSKLGDCGGVDILGLSLVEPVALNMEAGELGREFGVIRGSDGGRTNSSLRNGEVGASDLVTGFSLSMISVGVPFSETYFQEIGAFQ
jgi:hypothetical protein